ncbi:MAG: YHS domain-containing protein [Myxococcaceae bacterium]|jgi:YHS domain-containing protein|nr:YHS domain-containing protein [Myxococcaceae bacterium]
MRPILLLAGCVACAGPSLHERPAEGSALDPRAAPTARPRPATSLDASDPLSAADCELPTSPFVACPKPEAAPGRVSAAEASPTPAAAPERAGPRDAPPTPSTSREPVPARLPPAPRAQGPAKVKDPVCGMSIDPAKAAGGSVTRGGVTTFFCSATCKRAFLARLADGGTP